MLLLILLAPLVGILALLCVPSAQTKLAKLCGNAAALLSVLACVPVMLNFDLGRGMQLNWQAPWIPAFGATFSLAMDGYSLLLIVLTAALTSIALLASWNSITERIKEYYAYFLLMEFAIFGVFLARDALLFFVFWELSLIPMYLIIDIWGGPQRAYAAMKFLLYTLVGSMLMLVGILALYYQHHELTGVYSFAMAELTQTALPAQWQWWVFAALFAGFAVKIPMWPFHTWLPDAHVEAPTAGSVMLAGVMLKMGTYGFLRFSLPMLPDAAKSPGVVNAMGTLSIIAIIYGALVSLMQQDWKKLVAYSSVSHLGFCTLGIFALNPMGLAGSMLQQINHGISTSLLFLIVGIVYERRHTRQIADYSGLFKVMPIFTIFFLLAALSSMGMPPLNGFIGELAVLQGTFQMSVGWAVWGAIGIALGVAYLLWLFQRTSFGELAERNALLRDLSVREVFVCAPLVVTMVVIGIYPEPLFRVLDKPVREIVQQLSEPLSARNLHQIVPGVTGFGIDGGALRTQETAGQFAQINETLHPR